MFKEFLASPSCYQKIEVPCRESENEEKNVSGTKNEKHSYKKITIMKL